MSVSPDNIRDIIESAIDDQPADSAPVESLSSESSAEADARAERARDAAGRFARAPDSPVDATPEPSVPSSADVQPEAPRQRPPRPSSWKKDFEEKWNQIADSDPEMANYLLQREQQYAQGVSTYKAEAERSKDFQGLLEAHAPRFQQYGIEPTDYINRLLKMDEVLAMGSIQQKQEMLRAIAGSVGIYDLGAEAQPGSGYVPPELLNTVYGLQSTVQAMQQERERAEAQRYASEVDTFASDHPYLDELAEPMAQLLESGFATSMDDAYKKALRLNDELFDKYQAEQRGSSDIERQRVAKEAAQRARSAAVSPRSSAPTGSATAVSQQGGDIESIVAGLVNSAGGRI